MTTLPRAVFALLVAATFGAFFLAQRLKNSPSVVQQFHLTPVFSPNHDGRFDRMYTSFRLKRADDVTVIVVDSKDDEVRELASEQSVPAYTPVRYSWDGRRDNGTLASDGIYRIRVILTHQGRSVVVPRSTRLDVTPPHPLVTAIGPERSYGPELLPERGGKPAEIHLSAAGRHLLVTIYRMGPGRPQVVVPALPGVHDGARTVFWDGTISGRAASPGTYLVGVQVRDKAGNIGYAPALGRNGMPIAGYGQTLAGRGGITVRYLAAEPPLAPTVAGQVATFGIDARGARYSWSVRRVGSGRILKSGTGTRAIFHVHAPAGAAGVYLLQLSAAGHATTVPFAVQSPQARPVLVVLPVMTWQGRNPVDDDGDGLPNLLDRGVAAKLHRVYSGNGLPAGFAVHEAPLLAWLDREHHGYELTTDVALAEGQGPKVAGHRGVLIPGDARWLPAKVQRQLRAFVRGGGTVASFGTDSLRRQVSLTTTGRMIDPTPPATTDIFGARLRPVLTTPAPTTITSDRDDIGLFTNTNGAFTGFDTFESTASPGGIIVADAINPGLQPVIAATRVGKGLVLRYGLPQLATHLADANVQALLENTWTRLSR